MQDGVNKQLLEKINRVEMNFQMVVDWYAALKVKPENDYDILVAIGGIQFEIDRFKKRLNENQDKKD